MSKAEPKTKAEKLAASITDKIMKQVIKEYGEKTQKIKDALKATAEHAKALENELKACKEHSNMLASQVINLRKQLNKRKQS